MQVFSNQKGLRLFLQTASWVLKTKFCSNHTSNAGLFNKIFLQQNFGVIVFLSDHLTFSFIKKRVKPEGTKFLSSSVREALLVSKNAIHQKCRDVKSGCEGRYL